MTQRSIRLTEDALVAAVIVIVPQGECSQAARKETEKLCEKGCVGSESRVDGGFSGLWTQYLFCPIFCVALKS